jgi:Zn-dependent protease with chaperone function
LFLSIGLIDTYTVNNPSFQAQYFDGQSARAHAVHYSVAQGLLHVQGESVHIAVPVQSVYWGEYTRHGARMVHLPGGASLQVADGQALESLLAAQAVHTSKVARLTARWSLVLGAVGVLVALLTVGYVWGIPAGARLAAPMIPQAYQRMTGESTLKYLDKEWLQPSALPTERQDALRARWNTVVATAYPHNNAPAHTLVFRAFKAGPNAFALPGGTIVLTDELVEMMASDEDGIMGVLAHELGHVRHHHSMRLLIEVSALTLASSMIIGDYSGLLANAPIILGQLSYTRGHEHEADQEALDVMNAAGLDRLAMVRFFEKVRSWTPSKPTDSKEDDSKTEDSTPTSRARLPKLLSSHPLDEERIQFFREGSPGRVGG